MLPALRNILFRHWRLEILKLGTCAYLYSPGWNSDSRCETGQIADVNPFLMKLLGYSRKEFLGKALWEIRLDNPIG